MRHLFGGEIGGETLVKPRGEFGEPFALGGIGTATFGAILLYALLDRSDRG